MACGDSVHQRPDPAERSLPVGQPADGRHVARRDGRLRGRQVERQGRHLGRRRRAAHPQAQVHRGQRDVGAARAGFRRTHGVAQPRSSTAGHVNMASPTSSRTRSTSPRCPPQAATLAEKLKALRRHQRRLRGRSDHAHLPHQGVRQHRLLPRVDHHRDRAHRHVDPRALLRPGGVVARLRREQPRRAGAGRRRRRRPPLPLVVRPQRHAGLAGGAGPHPTDRAALRGVQLAGPDLTPSTFATGLFRAPPAGGGPTSPLDAYGYQGAAPLPSYSSPADYTFLWYDATAKGPDEEGVDGTGSDALRERRHALQGGVVPAGPVPMFSVAGSVTSYASPPDRGALRTRPGPVRRPRRAERPTGIHVRRKEGG